MSMPGKTGAMLRATRAIWRRSPISASPAPGYCTLTATSRPSFHRPLVDLADAGRGGRAAVEPDQVVGPVGPEVGGQLVAHRLGRHRRRVVLQAGEVLPVGRHQLVGQGGLEHAQRLAELHRPALELAERLEELLGRALLHLGEHRVRRGAAQPPPEAHRRTSCVAQRQGGEAGAAGEGLARELGHGSQCRRSVVTEVACDGVSPWISGTCRASCGCWRRPGSSGSATAFVVPLPHPLPHRAARPGRPAGRSRGRGGRRGAARRQPHRRPLGRPPRPPAGAARGLLGRGRRADVRAVAARCG